MLDLTLHLFYFPQQAVELRNLRFLMHLLQHAFSDPYHLYTELIQGTADQAVEIHHQEREDQKGTCNDGKHLKSPHVDLLLIDVIRKRHCIDITDLAPVRHDLISFLRPDIILSLGQRLREKLLSADDDRIGAVPGDAVLIHMNICVRPFFFI